MADDPYQILGVKRDATEAEIRTAYRKLAKKHHPDLNPGKPEAAERFKEINQANDILSDPEKRRRYDAGEIDAAGNEKPPERPFYRDYAEARGGEGRYSTSGNIDPEELEELLAQAFGHGRAGRGGRGAGGGRVQDARIGCALYADHQLPGCGERHDTAHQPAGWQDAGRADPRRRARRAGPAAEGTGQPRLWRRPGRRRIGGDDDRAAPVFPSRRRRHHRGAAGNRRGSDAGREPGSADDQGQGAAGHSARLGHRHAAAVARAWDPSEGAPVVELQVVLPPGDEPELAEFLRDWKPRHPFNPRAGMEAD